TLSTSGYAAARDRDRRLDVLEKHRLLYVAMTRARDHLVLAIHHKEQAEREQAKNSPGALVWDFCQRHPGLWRRPSAQSFVFATRAQNVAEAVTERHLEFLLEHFAEPSVGRAKEPGNQPGTEWAVRREEWLRNRRDKLEALRRQPVVSVTALAESELSQVGGGSRERDVAPFGGTTPAAGSASGDTALRFGRAVHAVLSSLDLSEHLNELDKTLRRADIHEISRRKAVSHRVPELADDVISAVQAALSTETMRNAARARHWRELFIAAPTDGGTVVEGYVDLVYETADGSLVVVDFKTDRLSASSGDEGRLLAYELQVAGYAATLERSTGLTVEQCVLVMLGTNPATESTIVGERLASLKMETTRIAEGFDQTGP
ncbi:MAG TPA: PD-(D/E)XK nuclease family protein, partial [Acidimicrobiales bacterium]|nr:PD-(D/E)XK nuclease family protein [Acidimicrobiales bacterium]